MDTRPINASLFVEAFTPTGNPGEYTFENARYSNLADRTGNGAFDVQVDFVLYVPASDFNTAAPIIGVVHRYKLTSVTVTDPGLVSGTMIWDESGQEGLEIPTNSIGCGLSQKSPVSGYGFAPTDAFYPDLPVGLAVQSVQTDLWNITDNATPGPGPGPSGSVYKRTIGDSVADSFTLHHALNTLDISVTVYELSTGADVYAGIVRTGPNDVRIDFAYPIETNSHRVIVRS